MNTAPCRPLRVLFVFRAPVGGLFRNVYDVVTELAARGHHIGIICDSTTGGARGEQLLGELKPQLALGLYRSPMRRPPHPADLLALRKTTRLIRALKPDVVHGEGAKGGLYARFGGIFQRESRPIRCYTPHGGSLNYRPGSLQHRFFMAVERILERGTDLFLFESRFARERFAEFVCDTKKPSVVALNGLYPEEFIAYEAGPEASDFFYVGEFREAKGLDTLIEALHQLAQHGRRPSLTLIGSGPDEAKIRQHIARRNLDAQVRWRGVTPTREALRQGRVMILPSRFESLPYVVLEAAGGHVPLIATDVGGIHEILPRDKLLVPDDPAVLARAMGAVLERDYGAVKREAAQNSGAICQQFTIKAMVDTIEQAYGAVLAERQPS